MTRRGKHQVTRVAPVALRHAVRFVLLSSGFLVVIALMALTEGIVLWLAGTRYSPKGSLHTVSVGDFSISANGEWGVSRICVARKSPGSLVHDVVLHNLRDQSAERLHLSRFRPGYAAVSPAAEAVAIAGWDGSIRICSGSPNRGASHSEDGEWLRRLDGPSVPFNCLGFSPDGCLLAAAGNRFTCLWRWPSGELLHKWPRDGGLSMLLSFSSDSRRILSFGTKGKVCLWDTSTGQAINVIAPDDGRVVGGALSPNAGLAALASDSEVRVYSLANDEALWWRPISGPPITFSPDGSFLATTAGGGRQRCIRVYDASSGKHLCELTGHDAPIAGLGFACDGLLYSWDTPGVIRAWNVERHREQWHFSTLTWACNDRSFREAP